MPRTKTTIVRLKMPAQKLAYLEELARLQGFPDLESVVLHLANASLWPGDRIMLPASSGQIKKWSSAAFEAQEHLSDWMIGTLTTAAEEQTKAPRVISFAQKA